MEAPAARLSGRSVAAPPAARLAWAGGALVLTLASIALGLEVVNAGRGHGNPWMPSALAAAAGFGVVGSLVAAGRRRDPAAWLLLAVGLSQALAAFGLAYGTRAATSAELPAGTFALWVGAWSWAGLAAVPGLLLLLSDGPREGSRAGPRRLSVPDAIGTPAS